MLRLSALSQLGAKKPSKYRAIKTADPETGEVLDSKKEARRYAQLRQMLRAGLIFGLSRQVTFVIEGGSYVADFAYFTDKTFSRESLVVEDSKGMKTAQYKQKKKQMSERYGLTIFET